MAPTITQRPPKSRTRQRSPPSSKRDEGRNPPSLLDPTSSSIVPTVPAAEFLLKPTPAVRWLLRILVLGAGLLLSWSERHSFDDDDLGLETPARDRAPTPSRIFFARAAPSRTSAAKLTGDPPTRPREEPDCRTDRCGWEAPSVCPARPSPHTAGGPRASAARK